MNKTRVLFLGTHNSARSPMAEAWLQRLGGDSFEVESAGLEPGTLKPLVIEAMRDVGIDLSRKTTQSVMDVLQSGRMFQYVIALYDKSKATACPMFPEPAKHIHWDIPERPKVAATEAEQLAHVRVVRDRIKQRVAVWLAENP